MFRPWLELARVSNLPTVWTNVLAAWLLAGGTWEWNPLTWLLLGGSLIYTGGMFLNDAADVAFDREHRPERPIPSGRISSRQAWLAGLGFLLGGFAMLVWGAQACAWLTGALVIAIVAYDLYHKPWAGSVFIMGSCRTFLFLAAASAGMSDAFTWANHKDVILRAIALGGYVVGLSLSARSESKAQSTSIFTRYLGWFGLWLPVLISLIMLGAHPFLIPIVWTISVSVVILVGQFLLRTPPAANIGRAVGLFLAGISWVDAMSVSFLAPQLSIFFAPALPLLLLWQRKIAAT